MCGIVAVLRRAAARPPPEPGEVLALVQAGRAALDLVPGATVRPPGSATATAAALRAAAAAFQDADASLRGVPGLRCLLAAPDLVAAVDRLVGEAVGTVAMLEAALDAPGALDGNDLEALNAGLVSVKDAAWALRRDRLGHARAVADLAGPRAGPGAVAAYSSVQVALSARDRLEVRGRDSAGVHLLLRGHGLDLDAPGVRALLADRSTDALFRSGAVRVHGGTLGFVYKAAAEIGELGDNTRMLRGAILADDLLRLALEAPGASAVVLGHTRWASVGIVSEANAHPVNSDEQGDASPGRPYVVAALNGDVDNHADLKAARSLRVAPEISTDSKVMPTLLSRARQDGAPLAEAFRHTVAGFEGSVAIAAQAADAPDTLLLAQRGSGQALYVGLAEDAYVVASEPYGLVEETSRYVRLDGENPADPENPVASRGQLAVLDGARAGTLAGIDRRSYDGSALPVSEADVDGAQITTRDIDRNGFSHFLLKEITESPGSFRTTLRGKLVERDSALVVRLAPDTIPATLRAGLADGTVDRVVVVGQGTAAVAAQSLADVLGELAASTPLRVRSQLATELSGFGLRADMSDTLVIAISQSGTTADTNRTFDLARARGAAVVAIVNRRHSDLTDKADGVLYTSDGRDVEMSVPSTKAFYAQIAAGCLLAVAVADAAGAPGGPRPEWLQARRARPDARSATLARRPEIATIAQQFAPARRYWAITGNGANRIAARELRIKLSELCYKSIALDSTEDKKHVDLSAEPLVLVCAAGLTGSNADDVAKELAIFRAHRATPVVIATEGEDRFSAAVAAMMVPATDPGLAFVLSALAGHLFGYEAALAIDAQARPLREARAAIEAAVAADGGRGGGDRLLARLRPTFEPLAGQFFDGLRAGSYDGHLEASTAVRVSSLLRYALGTSPLESYQAEHGRIGTPGVVIDDLTTVLSRAIEELTRPVDAIKHQAKTVTVGISRTDETLLLVPLVAELLAAGAPRDGLSYQTLRTLAGLDPAVAAVTGSIRYRVEGRPGEGRPGEGRPGEGRPGEGPPGEGEATAVVVDRRGIAAELASRTERNPVLRGTKHTVAVERQVFVTRGRKDGRTIVIVPELKDGQVTGITLLHVRFADRLSPGTARSVLEGYRNRFSALRDAVTETELSFREDRLAEVPVDDLLVLPIRDLADRWRE